MESKNTATGSRSGKIIKQKKKGKRPVKTSKRRLGVR
jgi:hypothetical protein